MFSGHFLYLLSISNLITLFKIKGGGGGGESWIPRRKDCGSPLPIPLYHSDFLAGQF